MMKKERAYTNAHRSIIQSVFVANGVIEARDEMSGARIAPSWRDNNASVFD
jgi:hypothetical protein